VNAVLHNNVTVKVTNMVDLKIIDDLIEEHRNSMFVFSDIEMTLSAASKDAHEWVDTCLATLLTGEASESNESVCPSELLLALRQKCAQRPKGYV